MSKILTIAGTVFKESLRNRVILSLIIISILLIFISVFISPIALGEMDRIIKDVGLSSISFFSLIIVLLAGTRLVYQEVEKKTIYLIITKPVSRAKFIIGKYLGLLMIILSVCAATGLFLILTVFVTHSGLSSNLMLAVIFIFFQFILLSAIAIFFSTFSSPVMSGLFTILMYIVGYLIKDLSFFILKTESVIVKYIIKGIILIVPNFYYTDIKLQAVNNIPLSADYILFTMSYIILYSIFFIIASIIIFERREF